MDKTFELRVKDSTDIVPMDSISVDTAIKGFLLGIYWKQLSSHRIDASVTMIFKNDKDKDLEGELVFPLDEGTFFFKSFFTH